MEPVAVYLGKAKQPQVGQGAVFSLYPTKETITRRKPHQSGQGAVPNGYIGEDSGKPRADLARGGYAGDGTRATGSALGDSGSAPWAFSISPLIQTSSPAAPKISPAAALR